MDSSELSSLNHEFYMNLALQMAQKAQGMGEVPVGAVVVTQGGYVVSEAYNQRENRPSPTAHAEILAIEEAAQKLDRWRLTDCVLYVTLEPCLMCAGAIVSARLKAVVYGARDPKGGAVVSLYQTLSDSRLNHRPVVIGGVLEQPCSQILTEFFRQRRTENA